MRALLRAELEDYEAIAFMARAGHKVAECLVAWWAESHVWSQADLCSVTSNGLETICH